MFCDLVGSTAISVRPDPEDLREVIAAYQRCVAEVVRRHDGFLAKYMGDGRARAEALTGRVSARSLRPAARSCPARASVLLGRSPVRGGPASNPTATG
jgi:hypothetical protein